MTSARAVVSPGEQGKAVKIDKDALSKEDRKTFDLGWQRNAFNQYASDMIALHRTLPDIRDAEYVRVRKRDNYVYGNRIFAVRLHVLYMIVFGGG